MFHLSIPTKETGFVPGGTRTDCRPPGRRSQSCIPTVAFRPSGSVTEGGFGQLGGEGAAGWPGLSETCSVVMRGNRKCN